MPQFNPGDQVRRISPEGGHADRIRVGEVYTVVEQQPTGLVRVRGQYGGLLSHRYELALAAPQPEEAQTATFYTLFYRNDIGTLRSWGVDTQEAAEQFKREHRTYTFLAMKKIKINLT